MTEQAPIDASGDKRLDVSWYDERARNLLASGETGGVERAPRGAASIRTIYRAPYLFYEQCIRDLVRPSDAVLELGAGIGVHTWHLLRTGAHVTATDLSPNALAVLEDNLRPTAEGRLRTRVADIEALPFDDASFDVVTCAGSLSYGDPHRVDAGVLRVLKPGGAFVCIDSLNHNPVYRFNRWVQYRRGIRTLSTLRRMATIERLQSLGRHFTSADIRYFGGASWAMPLVGRLVGQDGAAALSDALDRLFHVRRSAFKFVLVARGKVARNGS